MKTQPPGAPTTAADVADVYLRALSELRLAVVEQGELTRKAVNDCTNHVLSLSARVDALERRLTRAESVLGLAANG